MVYYVYIFQLLLWWIKYFKMCYAILNVYLIFVIFKNWIRKQYTENIMVRMSRIEQYSLHTYDNISFFQDTFRPNSIKYDAILLSENKLKNKNCFV